MHNADYEAGNNGAVLLIQASNFAKREPLGFQPTTAGAGLDQCCGKKQGSAAGYVSHYCTPHH